MDKGILIFFFIVIMGYSFYGQEGLKKVKPLTEYLNQTEHSNQSGDTVKIDNNRPEEASEAVYNLSSINAYYNVSCHQKIIQPFKIVKEKVERLKLTLLNISHNGEIALAVTFRGFPEIPSDNIARLIDLRDGAVFFEFPYEEIIDYSFSSDDSKLYYLDKKFVKQLDIKKSEITNLFEIETEVFHFGNFLLDNNTIHVCHYEYRSTIKVIHYSYDLVSKIKHIDVIFDDYDKIKHTDIPKIFELMQGNIDTKLLHLRLLRGDIKVKPLNKESKNEYLIIDFPDVFVLRNGKFVVQEKIRIFEGDEITGDVYEVRLGEPYYIPQLTDDNVIMLLMSSFSYPSILYTLPLIETANGSVRSDHHEPFKIEILHGRFLFVHRNEKTGKLFYQIDDSFGCNDVSYQLTVTDAPLFGVCNINEDELFFNYELEKIDHTLYDYYSSIINKEVVKNQPFETDSEKYQRVKSLYEAITPQFNSLKDSLFHGLIQLIKDSVKIINYDPEKIFMPSNYNIDGEYWRLVFDNPIGGKDFSMLYKQSKQEAKNNHSNNFVDISISTEYYYNLLSLSYECFSVTISNLKTAKEEIFLIPFKDASLLKNLYLTDNSYTYKNKHVGSRVKQGNMDVIVFNSFPLTDIDCRLKRGDVYYDYNILKYFVNNGKPSFFLNYKFLNSNTGNKSGVRVLDLDDTDFDAHIQNEAIDCCPSSRYYSGHEYLRIDPTGYFINKTTARNINQTMVYEISKTEPISNINNVLYPGQYSHVNHLSIVQNLNTDDWYDKTTGRYGLFVSASTDVLDNKSDNKVHSFDILMLGKYPAKLEGVRRPEEIEEKIDTHASFSPNGKYLAIRSNTTTYLYSTLDWSNIVNFENTEGKIYWDCNSMFLGIGYNVIPTFLLDSSRK